jgi:hypothetical protein
MDRNKVDRNLVWSVRASLDMALSFKRDELMKNK